MEVVCLGLLLFSLAWAAPTLQPQTEKTKQGCVEEQRITYKGHHEKHEYYIYKHVYTSPGRKNQSDMKQEERNEGNITVHHLGMKRKQELPPEENVVQEREKNLSFDEANENNQNRESQSLSAKSQMLTGDPDDSSKEGVRDDVNKFIYPASTGTNGAEDGNGAIGELHGQEEYDAALVGNNMRHLIVPVAAIELLGVRNKKNKLRAALSKIPGAHYVRASPKRKKTHQTDAQTRNSPVKNQSIRHIQYNTDYLKQLPKAKKIPSDFEGSGYRDLPERGDNNISPFSGDGQPFEDIPGKGGATARPDLDQTDVQTGFSGSRERETSNFDTRRPGSNEIPEKEESAGNGIGSRKATTKEADAADVGLLGGSNHIMGSTDFKELPGKEGNRVDAGSQNAHQGKVEFHYPHGPSQGKRRGSSGTIESTNYNEIPKNGKGSTKKSTEGSNRNQVSVNEKQRFSAKGKSQGLLIPSHGVDNGIKSEIGPRYGPLNEGNTITYSDGRKSHYTPRRQNESMWNRGMSRRKGSWNDRKSDGSARPPPKDDSSESSESDSSSDSDGD